MVFLKWYSVIILIIFIVTALKSQLNNEAPKGYFIFIFITFAPILFYIMST